MELKSLLVDSKTAWIEFPGLDGFELELANLSRKELGNLRKRCTSNKFDRKLRIFNEELDEAKFVKEFTEAVIKVLRRFNSCRFKRTKRRRRNAFYTRKCSSSSRKFSRI